MHSQSSRTPGGSCCRSASPAAHGVLPLVRPFGLASGRATHAFRLSHPSQQRLRTSLVVYAQPGPDKGSVAALEAAISAINNILGTYNKVRGGKIGPGGSPAGVSSKGGALQRTSVGNGPSKLISFTAKASSSVPVKEVLTGSVEPHEAAEEHSSSHNGHSSHKHQRNGTHHKHKHHKHADSSVSSNSSDSWLGQLTGKQPPRNIAKDGTALPQEALARSLQAYLSLPLEQYSVLDPKLITRLPAGTDVEAYLAELLAEHKARRADYKARQQQYMQDKQQQQQGLQAVLEGGVSTSSGGSSSGTSLHPRMRPLQELGKTDSSTASSNGSSSNGAVAAMEPSITAAAAAAEEWPAAAAAEEEEPAGAFLLRIPMMDLLGVDLEPLLVIYVDIDDKHGQVKFRANRLVIGDQRFDQEFKVDLVATMSSKVTQQAVLVQQESSAEPAAAAAVGLGGSGTAYAAAGTVANGNGGASGSSSDGAAKQAALQTAAAAATEQPVQPEAAVTAIAAAEPVQEETTEITQLTWHRNSALGCKVKLGMTLRLPHPLSIVPGPLLSTTAGLVAKLVMQALLPSFLELLATDYGRWASGKSTASRQALPAGSLVASGKQQLQQLQQ